MRERLIEELDGADLFLRNRANSTPTPLNEYDIEAMLDIAKICDEAARVLERAIVPPCKVGDTVWFYDDFMWGLIPCEVDKPYHCICGEEGSCTFSASFTEEDFGKTVFLTKEEAEKELKGGAE